MKTNAAQPNTVPMVTKLLSVLEAFRRQGPRLSLTDVIDGCKLPKATAYRILETLRQQGYLARGKQGSYRLTFKLLDVAATVQERSPLRRAALPLLERLQQTTGETINLGTFEGEEVIYVDVLPSSQSLRMVPRVGSAAPIHATALGKAIAAWLPEDDVGRLLRAGRMKRFTNNTIISEAILRAEFEEIRRRGYSVDNEEDTTGCICVGSAIIDARGSILGAASAAAPSSRMPAHRIARLGRTVSETTLEISRRFGFTDETHLTREG
jgi:IclR family acetate operon transcriptional repressor